MRPHIAVVLFSFLSLTSQLYSGVAGSGHNPQQGSPPRTSRAALTWYTSDTAYSCLRQDIRSSGTTIDTSRYFLPPEAPGGAGRKDDGTAGPISMGGTFIVYEDTFRYAWVGINGGIALTKSATDTSDLNLSGFYPPSWNFPYAPVRHGRSDIAGIYGMPRMFIAPMWADHFISLNSPPAQNGRIVYGDNGDPCQFIVEWDSMGTFNNNVPVPDKTTFRVILNRCERTIEFQYDDVGSYGLENKSLIGMQYDTSGHNGRIDPYFLFNRQGVPTENKPRNNFCVRFSPAFRYVSTAGWNLVSAPCTPVGGDFSVEYIFPPAVSQAYEFDGSYSPRDSLAPGGGYWLKLDCSDGCTIPCDTFLTALDVPVYDRWNLIGTIGRPMPVNSITAVGTTVASQYFAYDHGYYTATLLEPGRAYWVKTSGQGTLQLRAPAVHENGIRPKSETPGNFNRLTISDNLERTQNLYFIPASENEDIDEQWYELPPLPPSGVFDARFENGGMLSRVSPGIESIIRLKEPAYPLHLSWHTIGGSTYSLIINGRRISIHGSGDLEVTEPIQSIVISTNPVNTFAPKESKLRQNYPNPFNPTTLITYDVAQPGYVTLRIFNLLGEEVATLINGVESAGTREISWDASLQPAGVYFCRLQAGSYSATTKLILAR